jgi:hypothetical protein
MVMTLNQLITELIKLSPTAKQTSVRLLLANQSSGLPNIPDMHSDLISKLVGN